MRLADPKICRIDAIASYVNNVATLTFFVDMYTKVLKSENCNALRRRFISDRRLHN